MPSDLLAYQTKVLSMEQDIDRRKHRGRSVRSVYGDFSGSSQEPDGQLGGALQFNGRDTYVRSDGNLFDSYNIGENPATLEFWFQLAGQPTAVGSSEGDFDLPEDADAVGDVAFALPGMRPAFVVRRDVPGGSIRGSWYWKGGNSVVGGGSQYFASEELVVGVWYYTGFAWSYDSTRDRTVWRHATRSEDGTVVSETEGEGTCPVGTETYSYVGTRTRHLPHILQRPCGRACSVSGGLLVLDVPEQVERRRRGAPA